MRLIDADALSLELQVAKNSWCDSDSFERGVRTGLTRAINGLDSAPTIKTKQIKYYDEDEKVWKIGAVIIDSEEG